jgi:hypothetical protein
MPRGRLKIHIHAFEEMLDPVVGENLFVELADRGIDRRCAAKPLK